MNITLSALGIGALLIAGCSTGVKPGPAAPAQRLALSPCRIELMAPSADGQRDAPARCGTFTVPEDRSQPEGRLLRLRVIVVTSRTVPAREPVFFLSGGPGEAATDLAGDLGGAPYLEDRDLVLMDVRGTDRENGLDCDFGGTDENPQSYYEPFFGGGARVDICQEQLSRRADLRQYTTSIAMQDVDDLRQALGYRQIVLEAGSYGTRAALTYLRMFDQHVRAAALYSSVPIENRSPLYHARAAQRAIDALADACRRQSGCAAAFPDVIGDLDAALARLRNEPARVTVDHPATGAPVELTLSATGFADGLRVMLYSAERARRMPLLLHRARDGDFSLFAAAALQSSRGIKQAIRAGLLLSFTCSEDVWRIRPEEIEPETRGSFIGDARVRAQMAACEAWPRGEVPDGYYQPFTSTVPVLLFSGEFDPVTPPAWGEVMRRSFPNSVHIIVPRAHTPADECTMGLTRRLFDSGSIADLDTSCAEALTPLPFVTDDSSDADG